MTLLETLNHFIQEQEANIESISWEIREETNYTDEHHSQVMKNLSEDYDTQNEHLINLKLIKHFLINSGIIHKEDKMTDDGDNL